MERRRAQLGRARGSSSSSSGNSGSNGGGSSGSSGGGGGGGSSSESTSVSCSWTQRSGGERGLKALMVLGQGLGLGLVLVAVVLLPFTGSTWQPCCAASLVAC